MNFSTAASWIWDSGEASPHNLWLRLRRVFTCRAQIKQATLLITADSRYELFVNGHDIGNGPVRSFPWSYPYDSYDITSWLQPDTNNVLAARVLHWGDHTFQYIRGRGGFLCELLLTYADGSKERISSDERWLVSPDPTFTRNTPRISIQQGFEEQYDARQADAWTTSDYSPSNWTPAQIVGPIGTAPWLELTPRTIPFLSRETVLPTKVLAAELAQTPTGYRWCFDMRERASDLTIGLRAETLGTKGFAFATEIIADQDCTVQLHRTSTDYSGWHITCNGLPIQGSKLPLRAGRNLFVTSQAWWPSFLFETSEKLSFDASRIISNLEATSGGTWAYLGPFDERDDTAQRVHTATSPEELPDTPRVLITEADTMEDIFLLTRSQHFLLPPGGFCDPSISKPNPRTVIATPTTPLLEKAHHLLHENADYTLLRPQAEGDIHLIIDFGRELCGFPVLELDAPAGTIVDTNFFEGIDESGIFWTEGLRNSFRYICHEGYQTFRSHQRRGFRYGSFTFRIPSDQPVKLYNVRCLLNTYPVEKRGSFASSDALLNDIWEVAAYTVRLCMEDTYVDCPAYEQTFWVGDARNSALVNSVAFGASDLTARCLDLVAQSLSPRLDQVKSPQRRQRPHLTTDHTVSGWFSEIPMWTFLWIWNVLEHYQITGERETLARLYPAVRECLQRCLSFLTPRGLMDIPDVWNLVDWSAMDLTNDGEVTSSNALLVESLRRAALMAEELARTTANPDPHWQAEAREYRASAERIYEAINTYCWSAERGAYVDTVRDEQAYDYHTVLAEKYGLPTDTRDSFLARTRVSEHTNTLILLCHCAPTDRAQQILPLVEASRNGKFVGSSPPQAPHRPPEEIVPVGSPWFLFFTLETLLAYGQIDTALTIIREQWGRMLEKGATTFWETFPDLRGAHWSRSLCHGWSAAPAYFLSTLILGVQPATPGYQHISIAPHQYGLQWAKGTVPTPQGDVTVQWTRQSQSWDIEIVLPASSTGELILDDIKSQPRHTGGSQGEVAQTENGWRVTLPQGSTARYQVALA